MWNFLMLNLVVRKETAMLEKVNAAQSGYFPIYRTELPSCA
jgi:hypothetical protein